ncbi:uncharacterized protein [Hoplias malabaricus]|uniref:uncharacterized protein isoform X2 n=1 Tax=Hoplias malabaricus TaxID=27720 RepID=UPI0034633510
MTVFFVPEKLVRKEDLVAFRAEARKIIPKKLKRLCESPNHFTLQIFGLLAGYFIVGTGHRTGVLTNMTVDEVMAAESSNGNILIEVTHHKSAGTYGWLRSSSSSSRSGGGWGFRQLRTSMVHHTKNLPIAKRRKIQKAMCHSEEVANKFYVPFNDPLEAAEVAALQLSAIVELHSPIIHSSPISQSSPDLATLTKNKFI